MNARSLCRGSHSQAGRLLISVVSLCILLAAGSLSVGAAYDPTRPTSDRHSQPPDGSGGGDGGSGGGSGGGGSGGGGTSDRTVALGVAQPPGRSLGALDDFTASVGGHAPAIWAIWSQWGYPDTSGFPAAMADGLRSRGVTPIVWWEPVDPRDSASPNYARHQNITRGDHDAYIRRWAKDAKAFGGTLLLRFAQEANGGHFPWSIESFDNSPESFIAAWRHVHGIFQSEGATNVRFVWSVARQPCSGGCNPYTEVYPGDPYVDVMAFSAYNWGSYPGKSWKSMYDSYSKVTGLLREISAKPIMVAETASNSDGGDKPGWIRDGYPEVYERLPDIRAIVYVDADLRDVGHPDWRIASPPAALDAYAEIAAMSEFSGTWPLTARQSKQSKKLRADDERKADRRDRREAKSETDQGASTRRTPQVRAGGASEGPPAGEAKLRSARPADRSKKGKHEDTTPPQTIDAFSR